MNCERNQRLIFSTVRYRLYLYCTVCCSSKPCKASSNRSIRIHHSIKYAISVTPYPTAESFSFLYVGFRLKRKIHNSIRPEPPFTECANVILNLGLFERETFPEIILRRIFSTNFYFCRRRIIRKRLRWDQHSIVSQKCTNRSA
jgi:hypothetical protein